MSTARFSPTTPLAQLSPTFLTTRQKGWPQKEKKKERKDRKKRKKEERGEMERAVSI